MGPKRAAPQGRRPPRWGRVLALAALTLLTSGPAVAAELATQAFRDEHREMKAHLGHVATWTGQLVRQPPAQRRKTAEKVVAFFEQHLRPHAQWEEAHLYPLIDRLAGTGEGNRFTATMRYEHRVVDRWIGELRAELRKPAPDYGAFARRTDNLLGLLSAHFEEEEEVLLPYADKAMTRAEFEQAVGRQGARPH